MPGKCQLSASQVGVGKCPILRFVRSIRGLLARHGLGMSGLTNAPFALIEQCLRHRGRIGAASRRTLLVKLRHDVPRFALGFGEHRLEQRNDELHRGVVVTMENKPDRVG